MAHRPAHPYQGWLSRVGVGEGSNEQIVKWTADVFPLRAGETPAVRFPLDNALGGWTGSGCL